MVGGVKVAKVIEEIRKLADAPRPTALLLVGETGVGKEIAARVLFEEITTRHLRSLAQKKDTAQRPVVLGPRFVALNCAALTETLSASELFGVGANVGSGVAARRGPFLEAGEGVVLLDAIEQKEEIFNYLKQSHISAKNTARLRRLAASSNREVAELATIVIEVAKVKPYKRRRLKVLARQRRDLLDALERTGLIAAHHG